MRATKSGKDRLTGGVGGGQIGGAGQLDVTQHISSKGSGGTSLKILLHWWSKYGVKRKMERTFHASDTVVNTAFFPLHDSANL